MYKCCVCGVFFDEPKEVYDPVGHFMGETAYEVWEYCPNCYEIDIERLDNK